MVIGGGEAYQVKGTRFKVIHNSFLQFPWLFGASTQSSLKGVAESSWLLAVLGIADAEVAAVAVQAGAADATQRRVRKQWCRTTLYTCSCR